jgi:hypothetical protein
LKVPDNLIGKLVKCPTCAKTFTAQSAEAAPPPEEETPQRSNGGGAARESEPEEEGRPRRRIEDDEGEEERPRRRRSRADDEDEDEDRPQRGRVTPHRGAVILVLGILGLVTGLGIILGPIAWSMGNKDLKEIHAGRMDREGEGLTNGGRICGMIATLLGALGLLCCIGYFTFIGAMIAGGGFH